VVAKLPALILKLSITHDLASSVHPEETDPDLITRFPAPHGDLAHGPPVASPPSPILRI
jgi:hypothetical protein